MIAIVIPIESEGSSFFNRRYAMFLPFQLGQLLTKNHQNVGMNLLNKKCKNKKKFLGGGGQIYHIWT